MLVRDGTRGLETLMVVRHHQIDYASGAAVFPGGKLALADRDARFAAHCSATCRLDEQLRALRVAGIRETFEECGLLLARTGGVMVDASQRAALHQRWHERVAVSDEAFVEMACAETLELALEDLMPFAHWVTPTVAPKRFDTHFFIAAAPPGQVAQHDGWEAVDSYWVRPADALDDCAERRRTIMFPTLSNLALLAQSPDVASALAAARARPPTRIQPTMTKRGDGKLVPRISPDCGYPALAPALMDIVAR
ncbi:MAG: hypothetical protein Q8L49_12305 [Burkholderiaceae bacterium]|nr:hypothetical protein [Burkholderiaceae bacterium]